VTNFGERQEEFCDLLETHRKIVIKVARAYCRTAHDVEDVMQEIVGQMWRSFPQYDGKRPFSTWAYRIALNVAISAMRSRMRHRSGSLDHDSVPEPVSHLQAPEMAAMVREVFDVIDQFDAWDRALILLYLDDFSHAEIAEILGISVTNVSTSLSRVRKRLARKLESTKP
jgi:RNA polymerase sigma-70 factor (ECF subfamily)